MNLWVVDILLPSYVFLFVLIYTIAIFLTMARIESGIKLTKRKLAYLFYVPITAINSYIRRGKIKMDDIGSIFDFYVEEKDKVQKRIDEWAPIDKDYKLHLLSRAEVKKVNKMYKDWGLKPLYEA